MHPNSRKVQEALAAAGAAVEVVEVASSTRTAEQAARAVGADVAQIVKSLVFVADGDPVLVLVSGSNRASVDKIGDAVGSSPVRQADPDTVKAVTGFAIGGVPPVAHRASLRTLVDADLMSQPLIWAAAGTPNSLFATTPAELLRVSGGEVADIKA